MVQKKMILKTNLSQILVNYFHFHVILDTSFHGTLLYEPHIENSRLYLNLDNLVIRRFVLFSLIFHNI